ncbi:cytochrome aa3 quinol oxidase subunit II [Lentibacillus sp. CBA3610]|uniref:cytochrome aa3 quinol oxidase subunit II n=1 Tax=Lentibacillus sp. CBA3610 TaxID=2518176 RepID=UPI0015956545|nr:cytochrome aa3 quinol oxidase subunit II [Lentibacillus sp. CBA3610]QKY68394.1 cytochrome aa3 quinol oxidase subunit II [Lentibacillus sp. CBA3610]
MRHRLKHLNKWVAFMLIGLTLLLSGCSELTVLDPKGPVAESQRDLILYALIFMLGIVVVVFTLFTIMVVKYRDKPNRKAEYKPDLHGNRKLETIWTIIPVMIVTALSIPTISTIFDLEKPPEPSAEQGPLVIHATAADWKWFFSYPEQGIETVNYLHIPTDRAIEFRLSSADSMQALWIPALGGQKYNMAGMHTTLYLQADEPGVYQGRNSNFNGEGFAEQTFKVHAENSSDFQDWVESTQNTAPELTQDQYDALLEPGIVDTMAFSSTHLEWVDHGTKEGMDYSIERHRAEFAEQLHLENGENHEHGPSEKEGGQ